MNKKYGMLDMSDYIAKDGKTYYSAKFFETLLGAHSEIIKSMNGDKKVITINGILDFEVVVKRKNK